MPTLTSHLTSHPQTAEAYTRATQSAFLSLAGQGRLPRPVLSQWLSQDRLYAQAYVRFIGGLLARLRLPVAKAADAVEWRVLRVLKDALDGIVRELAFFEDTAARYGLDLAAGPGEASENSSAGFGPNRVTEAYVDLFDSFGARHGGAQAASVAGGERTLLEGLVLLWATEKVYLDAWTYAREQGAGREGGKTGEDLDGGALRREFIPNWTSEEFKGFVDEIQGCLDEYAAAQGGEGVQDRALELWKHVLQLEEGFWPHVNLQDVASTM
ncbi:hypothetical protein JX265_010173 [Neoarthrinium moseri]|uniref:Thiaminase-2/PQQC domain-containing protein n=1 Tax=Neoarthrinium moseri TaxID=1658444 RepID=A0A9Q0AIJ4_9PEZI|nr:hypothetical protein JX265_010173 [Neoarthrinium moseri]